MINLNLNLKMFLLQSGIIPLLFLLTNKLFCKDATHMSCQAGTSVLKSNALPIELTWFAIVQNNSEICHYQVIIFEC